MYLSGSGWDTTNVPKQWVGYYKSSLTTATRLRERKKHEGFVMSGRYSYSVLKENAAVCSTHQ